MLYEIFRSLLSKYTNDNILIEAFWKQIKTNHTSKKRHYHTLHHLENLYVHLNSVKQKINNWDTTLFTLFYHDVIYNPLKTNNEEKSAALAEQVMKKLSVSKDNIEQCKAQIIATKKHIFSSDSDTNYFTDCDLSILGDTWDNYFQYFKNVRKEYAIYPNFIYNPGRKKVLEHFLGMDKIYKTDFFYNKFELAAKQNLRKEMDCFQ